LNTVDYLLQDENDLHIQAKLDEIIERNRRYTKDGAVATYIPGLRKANRDDLGICIVDKNKRIFTSGVCDKKFTIQSISKVVLLSMALMEHGFDYVHTKVGFEPSDNPFNSIVTIGNNDVKKPSNPMINSGAIAITSLIKGDTYEEKEANMMAYFKKFTANNDLKINYNVYMSERSTGDRNRAMAYLLKSHGFLDGNVDEILDLYFKQCSIEVDVKDLAMIGLNLADQEFINDRGCVISKDVARIVRTVMFLCGMYDGSGEFALKTGLPSKSGVGGGIMTCVSDAVGIGVFGPSLDERGNSVAGMKVLEDLSREFDLSAI
jgi:glutaminase